MRTPLRYSAEVRAALGGRRPVVALESTIIAHGMPYPQNLEMARAVEAAVRAQGACPATICLADGHLQVGLESQALRRLAERGDAARKCSTRDMPAALVDRALGATTVSATMRVAHAAGIRVFVTGGIGGVHRLEQDSMDISTDLIELARTPVAVVCAGIKSILDIPKTLEFLETHAVPVVAYGSDTFPAFFTQDSGVKAPIRRDSAEACAALMHASLGCGLPSGMLIGVPNPNPVPKDVIDAAIESGLQEAQRKGIKGQAVTPFLLKRVNETTQGVSLSSNIDLVINNARVGAEIARALFELESHDTEETTIIMGSEKSSSRLKFPAHVPSRGHNVLVVGGVVMDMVNTSTEPIIRETSNIGTQRQACGGVARNVSECLYRLGLNPLLVSAVGKDPFGTFLRNSLAELGISTQGIQEANNISTAVYSAVHNSNGSLDVAIADMRAFDQIDISAVPDETIRSTDMVVADGNLSVKTLHDLLARSSKASVPAWFEPTSVQKSVRIVAADALCYVSVVSPNRDELAAMSDAVLQKLEKAPTFEMFPLNDDTKQLSSAMVNDIVEQSLTLLLEMAAGSTKVEKHVIVTLGKNGVVIASINTDHARMEEAIHHSTFPVDVWGLDMFQGYAVSFIHLPGHEVDVKNCTGAGDSLVGGTSYGLLNGKNILESCNFGMVAARQSLASEDAISQELTVVLLEDEADQCPVS